MSAADEAVGVLAERLIEAGNALDDYRAQLLQARGEAAETSAELTRVKQLHADWLGRFFRGSAGWDARVSGLVLARAYRDAGLPLPGSLSHLAGQ